MINKKGQALRYSIRFLALLMFPLIIIYGTKLPVLIAAFTTIIFCFITDWFLVPALTDGKGDTKS